MRDIERLTMTQNQGQNEKKASSILTRTISGIVLLLLALWLVPMGGLPLFILNLCLSMVGSFELYRVFGLEHSVFSGLGYLSILGYYCLVWFGLEKYLTLMLILSLMAMFFHYVFHYPNAKVDTVAKAFIAVLYTGVMLSYVYQTRTIPDGKLLVWLIFISSWGSDTCAYVVGMAFGKHRMTPLLSPKKTIEGAVGGVLGAMLLGAVFAAVPLTKFLDIPNPVFVSAIACGIAALISMIGDLTASGIKRDYEIKDYGSLIPGHGGVLDRFDSVIFTAPAIYFALSFLS